MRTIVAGSRDGVSPRDVDEALAKCPWRPTVVLSGAARGVDAWGEEAAQRLGIPVERFPAQWHKDGHFDRAAGMKRNALMAEHAQALLAVWDGKSRGTAHMIKCATEKGLQVHVFRVERNAPEPLAQGEPARGVPWFNRPAA